MLKVRSWRYGVSEEEEFEDAVWGVRLYASLQDDGECYVDRVEYNGEVIDHVPLSKVPNPILQLARKLGLSDDDLEIK